MLGGSDIGVAKTLPSSNEGCLVGWDWMELDIAGQKNAPLLWWPPLIHIFLSSSLTSSLHDEVSVQQSKHFAPRAKVPVMKVLARAMAKMH